MYKAAVLLTVLGFMSVPGHIQAQNQNPVVQEIREIISSGYAYAAENLRDREGDYASEGALEFWSSGGLVQNVPPDSPALSYESFNLVPKYIWVIPVTDDVAVAQFYVEGSYQQVGQPPVDHYFTRATQVYVREGGAWKIRAAHFSPVQGGTGTRQTAIGG
ncbi:MAG TPA: hypothetical protein VLA36_10365 [Longimicrobiales bacterium]|nr:hypothetical protein [Longimicrobiales bacterium]